VQKAIQIGKILIEAKKECGYGNWIPWVKTNLNFGEEQARRYMRCLDNRAKLENPNPTSKLDLTIEDLARVSATPSKEEIADEERERAKLDEKIEILEREKEIVTARLNLDTDDDFSDQLQGKTEEEQREESEARMQQARDNFVLRQQLSEKEIAKYALEYFDHLYIHFNTFEKLRLARTIIKLLLKRYPQLNDESI
jgi:hypothetical protein